MAGSAGTARGVMGLKAGATGDGGMLWFCMIAGVVYCPTGASGGSLGGAKDLAFAGTGGDDRRRGDVSDGIRALNVACLGCLLGFCFAHLFVSFFFQYCETLWMFFSVVVNK